MNITIGTKVKVVDKPSFEGDISSDNKFAGKFGKVIDTGKNLVEMLLDDGSHALVWRWNLQSPKKKKEKKIKRVIRTRRYHKRNKHKKKVKGEKNGIT